MMLTLQINARTIAAALMAEGAERAGSRSTEDLSVGEVMEAAEECYGSPEEAEQALLARLNEVVEAWATERHAYCPEAARDAALHMAEHIDAEEVSRAHR